MSTKSTIAYSHHPDHAFHFYHECFDDDHVYLELEGANIEFECSQNRAMVRIPVAIWDVIRQYPGPNIELAEISDEALDNIIVGDVDSRIKMAEECKVKELQGVLLWGSADSSREEQLEKATEHYRKERDRQTIILNTIREIIKENWKRFGE